MQALLILLLIAILVLIWQASVRARDLAIRVAINTCRTRGVQFLDGTAALQAVRPVFSGREGPGIRRTYTFDYSEDGVGRRTGCIIMHNGSVALVLLDG